MTNAICGIKTSVCTGNCNSCVNSPLLGKTAVEEMEHTKSAYNKGYADGQKETAREIIKELIGLFKNDAGLNIMQVLWNIFRIAEEFGVEVEE